jgi:hypothetical protein
MFDNFVDTQAFGTKPFEAFTTSTASTAQELQAISAEVMDYAKKSFEKSRAHFEKLIGVTKIDEAMRLQSDFAKSAYEDFVAEATKIGNMYSNLAKASFQKAEVKSPSDSVTAASAPKSPVTSKQG